MFDLLTTLDWSAVGQIIMIDILLGGDNAVVIAMACRNLPPRLRTKGIILGTIGAIVLRVILIFFAVSLLTLPWLRLAGGALLLWIGIQLVTPETETHDSVTDAGATLWSAIRTVVIADLVMSIDNVIGISAAAHQAHPDHRMGLIVFGLLVSIPIIVWGSRFVITMIEKFPIIVWLGGALLGWIAGGLMITDVALSDFFGISFATGADTAKLVASVAGALIVVVVAWLWTSRRPADSVSRS